MTLELLPSASPVTVAPVLGPYANAMLAAPEGFCVALSVYGAGIPVKDMRELLVVGGRLEDALKSRGRETGLGDYLMSYHRFDPMRSVSLNLASEGLIMVPDGLFADAAREVMERDGYSVHISSWGRLRRLIHPPAWALTREAAFYDAIGTAVYGSTHRWDKHIELAARYTLMGNAEKAAFHYRVVALSYFKGAEQMLGFSEGSLTQNDCRFSAVQLKLARGRFGASAHFFAKAGSDINVAKARLREAAITDQTIANRVGAQITGEPVIRVTLTDMLEDLFGDREKGTDAEIVYFARYAAMGSDEAIEMFLRNSARIFAVKKSEIEAAIVASGGKLFSDLESAIGRDNVIFPRVVKNVRELLQRRAA